MLNDGNRRQHARHTLAAASNCRVTTAPSPAGRSRATGTVCVLRITRAPSVGHGGIVSGSVTQARRTRVRRSTAGNASELARPDSNQRAAD
jgi:hypothetical protein